MSYQKQQFVDGETVLRKKHMDHIEDGIANNSYAIEEIETNVDKLSNDVTQSLAGKVDGWFIEDNILYLTANGIIVGDGGISGIGGGGGGGGGGSGNSAVLTLTNGMPWLSTTVRNGSACPLKITWSSTLEDMPTGNGTLQATINGLLRATWNVAQGEVTVDVGPYLSVGTNKVRLVISDVYGNTRPIMFTIELIMLQISSTFDSSVVYSDAFNFPYTPIGSVSKTIKFAIDGQVEGTVTTSVSNREMSYLVDIESSSQHPHGVHTLECWFTATINDEQVDSNHLFYEFMYAEPGATDPIISTQFSERSVSQYTMVNIPYYVYDPTTLQRQVSIFENNVLKTTLTVGRELQQYAYRASEAKNVEIKFVAGSTQKTVSFTVTSVNINVEAETKGQELYLSAYGRSNAEEHPEAWSYNNIEAQLTNFNFTSDGWQQDNGGSTVLRIGGDARVTIPFQIFGKDFRTSGKTIEFEFATHDVRNYDTPIISCISEGRGLTIQSQTAVLTSEQSRIFTSFKDNEHVRISFVIQKSAAQRLVLCYINGIVSGAVQYATNDDFKQGTPVDISLGGSGATLDIYTIRVYDHDLSRFQMLDNWIADAQDGFELVSRYDHNNIFDQYGNIVIEKLPLDLPYMIISGNLPTYKGNKLIVSGEYVNPLNPAKSFTFENAQIDVQGTSSQYYARKNYKIKFNEGFITEEGTQSKYAMNDDAIPVKTFTFKADVASSEGANNVELARLYNEACPYKTPYQKANSKVRQGIDGFPIVIFHNDGTNTVFLGKYNFNNDKGTEEVFGFQDGDESWEVLNNTSQRVIWKSDDYTTDAWLKDFEGRYPEDNTNPANLYALARWLKSTDRTQATNNSLPEPVTYEDTVFEIVEDGEGGSYTQQKTVKTTYENDTPEYRLAKFKHELKDKMELNSVLFFYLFTELFLMVDNRAKNTFPSLMGGDKWCILPYDFDTALGINNEGSLEFSYNLEDIDHTEGGEDIYNGQESVLWTNLRDAFPEELKSMYQNLRSTGKLSYPLVEGRFEEHQGKWPEAIFNEDAQYKYIDPLINDNDGSYLKMLQGSKAEQRKWWMYNRFRYIDSKYNAGDAQTDYIQLRGYAKQDITVTPYADVYPAIKYGSYYVTERGARNVPMTLVNPMDAVNDTEIYIYSASQLADVGDLSGLKVGFADFSRAIKLQALKLGDSSSEYNNSNLSALYLGNNTLLKTIDVRNCSSLATSVDLSGCTNIENVYFDGTSVTGVSLPNGGIVKRLHLPGTITNLTVLNQTQIADFTCPNLTNLTTLRLENVSNAFNALSIVNGMAANSRIRLYDFHWEFEDLQNVVPLYDKLDTMRGLDQNGNNVDTAQLFGSIHVQNATGSLLAQIGNRYPDVTITYDSITSNLFYYDFYGNTLLHTDIIENGANGSWGATPSQSANDQYTFTRFVGWSLSPESFTADQNALKNITADRNVYAAYTVTIKTYTATFRLGTNDGNTILYVQNNVPYGTTPVYNASTPESTQGEDYVFAGWTPELSGIMRDTTYTAVFRDAAVPVRKYLKGSITDYDNSSVMTITRSAFNNCTSLKTVKTAATSIGKYAFRGCSKLETVEFNAPGSIFFDDDIFDNTSNLKYIIIRSLYPSQNRLLYWANGEGNSEALIYVPDSVVDTYKRNFFVTTSTCARVMGMSMFGEQFVIEEITDSDEDFFSYIQNGTAMTRYRLGMYKEMDLGSEGIVRMQIVGKNLRELSDSSERAQLEWVAMDALKTPHRFNPMPEDTNQTEEGFGVNGGYDKSELKTYIDTTIWDLVPQNWKNIIKETKIRTLGFDGSTRKRINVDGIAKLRIPSRFELGIESQTNSFFTDLIAYPHLFSGQKRRVRKVSGALEEDPYVTWWCRNTDGSYSSGKTVHYASYQSDNPTAIGIWTTDNTEELKYIVLSFST